MTPEELEDIAEVDALVLHVVDAWIADGCPGPGSLGPGASSWPELVQRLFDASALAFPGDWPGRHRAGPIRFWQRLDDIRFGTSMKDHGGWVVTCNAHPDCLRSQEVARLCWLAANPGHPLLKIRGAWA